MHLTSLALSLLLVQGGGQRDVAAGYSSYYNDKRYDYRVTRQILANVPVWAERSDDPPLPARRAIEAATAYLPKFVPDAPKWSRGDVTLSQCGKEHWVYLVEFAGPHPPGVIDGPVPTMRIVVLMNGQVLKPVISEYKWGR